MLKNLELFNGFYIKPQTTIEFIYDKNLNLYGYFFMANRKNYPFSIYIKLDKNFDLMKIYPYKFKNMPDERCISILYDKNIKIDTEENIINDVIKCFSLKYDDGFSKIKEFYLRKLKDETHAIKYDYLSGSLITKYISLVNYSNEHTIAKKSYNNILLNDCNKQIKNFIEEQNPDYGWVYLEDDCHIKKFTIGYVYGSKEYFKCFNKLNLNDIIEQSQAIAEKSRQA